MARYTLVKHTTRNDYDELRCPGTIKVNLLVVNNDVMVTFGSGVAGIQYDDDEHFGPTQASLTRSCDAIRVRSATRDRPAVVSIVAITEGE